MSNKKPPAIPDGATLRQTTANAYALLFGGNEGLATYLAKTAFGGMHFDVCCAATQCPAGIQEDDHRWCQDLLHVGTGLGLDNTQLRELFAAQWPLRGQHADALALSDLLGDEPPMVQ